MNEKNKDLLIEKLRKENKHLKVELELAIRGRNLAASFNVYRDHAKTEVASLLRLPSTSTPIEIINELRSVMDELADLRKLFK